MNEALLSDKVALVTGAARGIGRSEALALARHGACVVACDTGCELDGTGSNPELVHDLVRELVANGARAVASPEDVSAVGAADRLVELALSEFGRLDVLVSNAGVLRERTLLNLEDEDLDVVLSVHVKASFALTRRAARCMIDAKSGGSIVLTTGPDAFFGAARRSAQAAASAAIAALTRTAALELRKHGVRVNAIAPTARTRQTEHLPTFKGIRKGSMTPDHVAPLVVFLASDNSREVSGEILGVAGTRIYALRGRETSGAFAEGSELTPEAIQEAWDSISRG